ncbi:MAG: CvpA family protein [Patescibacteria group bacterium]
MSIFDICLLIILFGFIFNGLSKGLINLLGRVVGLIVGAYIASNFHVQFFELIKKFFNGNESMGKIVSFIVLFFIVTLIMDIIFKMIEKIFNFIAFIPGSKYINNLAGAVLGFFEGSLFLGLIIFVISRYALIGNLLGLSGQLTNSVVSPYLLKIVNIILPILPEALKALKSII